MQGGIQRSANSSTATLTIYRNYHADSDANNDTIADTVADSHPDPISN
jgi:hypothetical protein